MIPIYNKEGFKAWLYRDDHEDAWIIRILDRQEREVNFTLIPDCADESYVAFIAQRIIENNITNWEDDWDQCLPDEEKQRLGDLEWIGIDEQRGVL